LIGDAGQSAEIDTALVVDRLASILMDLPKALLSAS
jgi:hypothetical protein